MTLIRLCCAVPSHVSRVRLFATPWTIALQAPLSMGFSRQEYWSGLPFPSPLIWLGLCKYLFSKIKQRWIANITNYSSVPDSSCDCGNGFYVSFIHLPSSAACWCLSLGLMSALELLSLAAPEAC